MEVVALVKNEMCGWKIGRLIPAVDREFSSVGNLRHLQRAGGRHTAGEHLQAGMDSVEEALFRQSRYRTVRENLEIKELVVGDREATR